MIVFPWPATFMTPKTAITMKEMKRALLVFDEEKELQFIESSLAENGVSVYKSESLQAALKQSEKYTPELVVINKNVSTAELEQFLNSLKEMGCKKTVTLSVTENEAHADLEHENHLVMEPVRPKLLLSLIRSIMSGEKVHWLPAVH